LSELFELKYGPKSLGDFVFPSEESRNVVRRYLELGTRFQILPHGQTGTGKSALGRLICEAVDGQPVQREQILECGHDITPRDFAGKVGSLRGAFSHLFDSHRVVVIEEIDRLPKRLQEALCHLTCAPDFPISVVMTTNFVDRLGPSLRSRFLGIPFGYRPRADWLPRLRSVAAASNRPQSDEVLLPLFQPWNGDFRQVVKRLELLPIIAR